MHDSYKVPASLRPIILLHMHRVKWNYSDTHMNSYGIRWLYIMCWKWLLPSITDTVSTSWILSVKASAVWGLYLFTLSSRQSQRNKSRDDKSGDWGATGSFKGLSCSEAKTRTVKTHATQHHLLRPQHITHAVLTWTGNASEASSICFW